MSQSLARIELPDYSRGEEIFNMVSHIVGGALGIVTLVLGVVLGALKGSAMSVVSACIFGGTMILLYAVSSLYHGLSPRLKAKRVFRIMDHCSIYLLIAGSYTPITLCSLRALDVAAGWTMFGVVWLAAVVGITFTAIDMNKFRIPSMVCYLAMGWCVVAALGLIVKALGWSGFAMLLSGGVLYTVGAVIYVVGKKQPYLHSVFHLFVVGGSLCHSLCVLMYVL